MENRKIRRCRQMRRPEKSKYISRILFNTRKFASVYIGFHVFLYKYMHTRDSVFVQLFSFCLVGFVIAGAASKYISCVLLI